MYYERILMNRLVLIALLVSMMPVCIQAMDVAVKDKMEAVKERLVRAFSSGANGNEFRTMLQSMTGVEKQGFCRYIRPYVLLKVAMIEEQQTDAGFDDLNEALAL